MTNCSENVILFKPILQTLGVKKCQEMNKNKSFFQKMLFCEEYNQLKHYAVIIIFTEECISTMNTISGSFMSSKQ